MRTPPRSTLFPYTTLFRSRRPDLLTADDVVVTVAHGTAAQGGQVGPGRRLREPLTPHLVALEDGGQVARALFVGGLGDERRSGVEKADEVHADVGCAGVGDLLVEHQLLAQGGAAAAELGGPVDAGVPGVVEHPLPRRVPRTTGRPVLTRRFGRQLRKRRRNPGPELGPEALVLVRPQEVHRSPTASRCGRGRRWW